MRTNVHATGTPRLLRGDETRKGTTGGIEGAGEGTSFSTPQAVRRNLNSTASKLLSRITGRTIADEARRPSVDVVMRARDQRWNWLGHILRMEGHCLTRQFLLQCVKQTPESILGDISGLEIQAAIYLERESGVEEK